MMPRLRIARQFLFLIAGLVWTGVGVLLWSRALIWSAGLTAAVEIVFHATSVIIAFIGYRLGFSSIVKKNVDRLYGLPELANPFAFTGRKGYVMIALMIGIGFALRSSALPKVYLSIPYASMGGVLLIGSVTFYRNFLGPGERPK